MLYKQTIWYEIYRGRKIKWDSFEQYFDMNGTDESWYIYYVEEDDEPRFELHAHIEEDVVVSAEPFKADVYGGHGRPTINERSLTSSEKKYAISIFDECFIDRVGDSIRDIIDNAISSQVEYGGYKIVKSGSDHVVFISPEGKKVKLSFKNLINAIDYSHIDLAILRDAEFIAEFAGCFGVKNFEPLAAILLTIDPTVYSEYPDLERQYRYNKMEIAVSSGDVGQCKPYIDVLSTPGNNVQAFCTQAINQDNRELLEWLITNISGVDCDLSSVLGVAVKKDNESLFYYLLNSGLIDVENSDSTKWYSPMYVAAYDKCSEKYVMPLLKRGYSLAAQYAYKFYKSLSLDKVAELLSYKVEFDQNTINRVFDECREDIIDELEKEPLRFCSVDSLFAAYVHCGDFSKFSALLNSGYKNNNLDLFAEAYTHSPKWTDLWLQCDFDINADSSRLLHRACEKLEVEWAIYLLQNGANPRLRSQCSQTVFEKAAGFHGYLNEEQLQGKNRLCKFLLDIGLDPISESRRGPSILTYLFGRDEEFDFVLIDWLAQNNKINAPDLPETCDDTKHLPISNILDNFSDKYKPSVLKYFIAQGAILNAAGITEDKLFISACELCDLEELKLVVSAGADISEADKYYRTNGLYAAVRKKRPLEIIEYLVEIGVDVNCIRDAYRNTRGVTVRSEEVTSVLDIAIQNGDAAIIEYLKGRGALFASELINNN